MESPHDTNRLRYFISDLIYIFIKCKIFINYNAKEFDSEGFRNDWFSNFNVECVFLLDIIIYEILLTFRESLLVLSQLSAPDSFSCWL